MIRAIRPGVKLAESPPNPYYLQGEWRLEAAALVAAGLPAGRRRARGRPGDAPAGAAAARARGDEGARKRDADGDHRAAPPRRDLPPARDGDGEFARRD